MLLKNSVIYNSIPVIQEISKCKIPIKLAYNLKKTLEGLNSQASFLENQHKELLKKYGEEKGTVISIDPTNEKAINAFYHDWEEVLNLSEEIDIREVSIDDFGAIDLTIEELTKIEFMIKEDN